MQHIPLVDTDRYESPGIELAPGTELCLTVLQGQLSGIYQTTLEVADRDALYLVIPLANGQPVMPPAGTPVRLSGPAGRPVFDFATYLLPYEVNQGPVLIVALPRQARLSQRRQNPRLAVNVAASVVVLGGPPGAERSGAFATITEDLSLGGAALRSYGRKLKPGVKLAVSLLLPGHPTPRELMASVRWSDPQGKVIGVQFAGVEPRERAILRAFLQAQTRIRRANELTMAMYGIQLPADPIKPGDLAGQLYRRTKAPNS